MKNDKNILIIESERIAGLELQQQFEKEGFSVSRPISLFDTEAIIAIHKPDFVVANISIKKQYLFEQVKKYFKKLQLPLIWIGTLTNKDVSQENDGLNVIGTFSKPFDGKKIVALIVSYFHKMIILLSHK